nr:hypothetical protein [Mesorhizobium sp.]
MQFAASEGQSISCCTIGFGLTVIPDSAENLVGKLPKFLVNDLVGQASGHHLRPHARDDLFPILVSALSGSIRQHFDGPTDLPDASNGRKRQNGAHRTSIA